MTAAHNYVHVWVVELIITNVHVIIVNTYVLRMQTEPNNLKKTIYCINCL